MDEIKIEKLKKQREKLIFMIKLSEESERYEDMLEYIKKFIEKGFQFTLNEINLFSIACNYNIGTIRTSWRVISSISQKENVKKIIVNQYLGKIEKDLLNLIDSIIQMIELQILPFCNDNLKKITFMKYKSDFCRYKCGIETKDKGLIEKTDLEYQKTAEIAEKELAVFDPLYLGTMLNYAVYKYEICQRSDLAIEMARNVIERYEQTMKNNSDNIDPEVLKNSNLIIQLFRDNINLWENN